MSAHEENVSSAMEVTQTRTWEFLDSRDGSIFIATVQEVIVVHCI